MVRATFLVHDCCVWGIPHQLVKSKAKKKISINWKIGLESKRLLRSVRNAENQTSKFHILLSVYLCH